ncbi:MAG: alanyl-tRNA editing protein [Parachlamydiaceae bacterium]|nr:alanyl-tRNA editing protein [Parachlamydiaceae bacterium]
MTIPLYLHNAYLKEAEATILEVVKESDKRWLIAMDQTLFYPRGGGQSTDQGIIISDSWKGKVTQALQKEDRIVHEVEGDQPPAIGTVVKQILDWERRYLHMRLHSAGHVVDFALYLLGYSPALLMPLKGDHGKKAVICYQGTLEKDIKEELEKKANELVARNLTFSFKLVGHKELEQESIYLQPGLPKNKPLRLLSLNEVGSVADGGTQVNKTSEVGKISILPIETKAGMTYIHYRLL